MACIGQVKTMGTITALKNNEGTNESIYFIYLYSCVIDEMYLYIFKFSIRYSTPFDRSLNKFIRIINLIFSAIVAIQVFFPNSMEKLISYLDQFSISFEKNYIIIY